MSKSLEALEKLGEMTLESEYGDEPKIKGLTYYKIIEKALKALEIIKNKDVLVHLVQMAKDLNQYNELVYEEEMLTQEEYDLLKEVLL